MVVLDGKVSEIRRRFSKKLYQVGISNTMKIDSAEGLYNVEQVEPSPLGGIIANIRLDADASLHDAIAHLNDRYTLAAFQELLPSMNEIFIETVSTQTQPTQ